MKLLSRYSLINLIVMILIFLVSSFTLYELVQIILIREMDADLNGIEQKVKAYTLQYRRLPEGHPLDEERISFSPTGQTRVDSSRVLTLLYSEREGKMHNFRQFVFPLYVNGSWYKTSIAKPVEGMRHLSGALVKISLITIFVTILISLALNNILLRRLWKPFYESLGVLRDFKLGSSKPLEFPATGIEEFAFMNECLLMSSRKAEQDYLLLKEFTENASHEMQTPLSVVRSKLDMLIQEKNISERQSQLAIGAYSAVKRLSRLNHSLLLMAKIENRQYQAVESIDLSEKLREKIMQFQELWQNTRIEVSASLEDSTVRMNPQLLDILLNNLLSNAGNHNTDPGHIGIRLRPGHFEISNSGRSGALDEQRLFTRFYKVSVNNNSNGLGLSIVKQITNASGIEAKYRYRDDRHYFSLEWS